MSFPARLLPALLCALLFAGAFPPFNQWWLAWFWLLPLLFRLWRDPAGPGWKPVWAGFRLGWVTGFLTFLATLWWAGHVTVPGMLALCSYLALFPAVWSMAAAALRPSRPGQGFSSALTLALLWTGLEWMRGWLLTGFPWNGAAVPLIEMPGLRSLAAFTGVTGLSLVPVFFMAGLAASWVLRRHRNDRGRAVLLAATLATPAVLTLLFWEKSPAAAASLPVLLVQPNVSMEVKMNLDLAGQPPEAQAALIESRENGRYQDLARLTVEGFAAAGEKPLLAVWPESAVPRPFHDPSHAPFFAELFRKGVTALLTGTDALTATGAGPDDWNAHNCAALIDRDPDQFALHAKVHLVPFGEYIPLRRQLPFLESMLGHLIPTDFAAGTSLEPLAAASLPCTLIPLVCFEDTIASLAREFVRDTPQLIVNITNDNWFRESNESAIHALNARWRCIELQRPMVRAANTGVTAVIDTEGRLTASLPRWKSGVLHASVPLPGGGLTFYAARGEWAATAAGAAGLLLLAALLRQKHTTP